MQRQYHHPMEKGFAERIHRPGGVRSLVEESNLMALLRKLNEDGFNIDGPMAELTVLVNYVTSSQISMKDLQSHLDYCVEKLRQETT
nr:MAG TPA: repressor protein [Caudoviricetes sp.]